MKVTQAASRHLRSADPDASFVYLGLVDETAHLVGSATPAYADSIATTDRRIGQVLRAVRSRPSYPFESWTILVTTDHGQRALDEPSLVTHLSQTPLEITSFVIGSGPGLGSNVKKPLVVDVAPTVLRQLGLPVRPAWKLDGRPLAGAHPAASATVAIRGKGAARRLAASLRLSSAPAGVRSVALRLPAGVKLKSGPVSALGERPAGVGAVLRPPNRDPPVLTTGGTHAVVRHRSRRRQGRIRLQPGAQATVGLRGRKASRGTLRLRLAH